MTFTYNLVSPFDDVARIRFHTGDVDSTVAVFSDEELRFRIAEDGDWKHAVIACLESLIARIAADPNFSADWLRVDNNSGLQYYDKLLSRKRQEFGITGVLAVSIYPYRADSGQSESPTFNNAFDTDADGDDD